MTRFYFVAAAMLTCLVAIAPASAQYGPGNSPNNLFSQYTTPNGPTAAMYPAPHPTPYLGSQSYYTYQPLMPHEMMYQHQRNYYNYYNTGGYMGGQNALNKTTVTWQSGVNHIGNLPFSTGLSRLQWGIQKRIYCIDGNCGPSRGGAAGGCRGGDCGGSLRGHKLRGGLGCNGGDCGASFSDAGCASGGCTANLGTDSVVR